MAPIGDTVRKILALGLLASLEVGLRVLPFDRTRTGLVSSADRLRRVVIGSPSQYRIAQTVERVDRSVPGERTCLVRSLTTETLLRFYGYEPIHRIGVDKTGAHSLEAHSWLELDDEILIGQLHDLSRYESLPPLNVGDDQ